MEIWTESSTSSPIGDFGGVKPEKYDLDSDAVRLPTGKASPKFPEPAVLEAQATQQFTAQQAELLTLGPEAQWEAARATLKLLAGNHLGEQGVEALREMCLGGHLSATVLARELSGRKAKGEKDLEAYLDQVLASGA